MSFATASALAFTGLAAFNRVRDKRYLVLASIPSLFALQQYIEGALWLSLLYDLHREAQSALVQGYAFFAGILWPVLAPLSVIKLEQNPLRRKVMLVVLIIGMGIALYTMYGLLLTDATARIDNQCIKYEHPLSDRKGLLLTYLIATCGAFFLSTEIGIRRLGVANIIGFLIAYRFYEYYLVSVWCFFAAIISCLIYFYLARLQEQKFAEAPADYSA